MRKHIAVLCLLATSWNTQAMSIDEYMSIYKNKNALLRSSELSVEALEGKVDGAETELAPTFSFTYAKGKDESLPAQLGTIRRSETYQAGLAKRFFTGTSVQLNAQNFSFDNQGAPPMFGEYSTGLLGVTISQSLWKDFFGAGTRTRIERQKSVAQLEITSADLQRRSLLIQAESVFWDYVAAQEDLNLKKSNLDRAKKVQRWTARRFENGISERADDLNAKALVSIREMELLLAENEYKNVEIRFREALELGPQDKTPVALSNWKDTRPYIEELRSKKNIMKIETYLSLLEAKTKSLVADETVDSLRPDLSVFGTYNYTSYDVDRNEAWRQVGYPEYPQSVVGVNFIWTISNKSTSGLRSAAVIEAEAARIKAEKNKRDGLIAWNEFLRVYDIRAGQVKILEQVADLQKRRSDAEADRFSKGRTVTAQVVQAETDSAEAATNLLRAKIGLRKYEASSLLFVPSEIGL